MRWPVLIASAALALAPIGALAHGGGVDGNGCHTNKKTGEYHCHGGGPVMEAGARVQAGPICLQRTGTITSAKT
jgi:hypothetical protein